MSVDVPLVWIVASHRILTGPSGHEQRYTAVDEASQLTLLNLGLQPVSYPRAPLERLEMLLDTVDAVLLGGSDTNVHPHCYGEAPVPSNDLFDPERDELAQALVRLALARRVPILGFCRGLHDLNVALGGSLHQDLKHAPHGVKHWEDPDESIDEAYAERHFVTTRAGGALEHITGMHRFPASSLHAQGVKEVGQGLVAEAQADDGLVEAVRWHDASQFAWGFQFHPEWGWRWHAAYGRIMRAYVDACWQSFNARRGSRAPAPQSPHRLRTA